MGFRDKVKGISGKENDSDDQASDDLGMGVQSTWGEPPKLEHPADEEEKEIRFAEDDDDDKSEEPAKPNKPENNSGIDLGLDIFSSEVANEIDEGLNLASLLPEIAAEQLEKDCTDILSRLRAITKSRK